MPEPVSIWRGLRGTHMHVHIHPLMSRRLSARACVTLACTACSAGVLCAGADLGLCLLHTFRARACECVCMCVCYSMSVCVLIAL